MLKIWIFAFSFLSVQFVQARQGREETCYALHPTSSDFELSEAVYQLCLKSHDLKVYPKSVVTITLQSIGHTERSVSQVLLKDKKRSENTALVKRHYSMLGKGTFGSRSNPDKPMVIFQGEKVYLGFIKTNEKYFYYKEMILGAPKKQAFLKEATLHQKHQSDILGIR